ncbi:hypothetical protein FNV43_RR20739 [Rhamnella rubrinervis]|uniref:Uncharacterized protein n=1 Tax=Rhamnella rubrinervis TaxID=2594499 RepID=A0A8K0GUU5_9ROSA|nr:hypothetical protein FNV43_RR20739 [Rhamnella rubrinervis]
MSSRSPSSNKLTILSKDLRSEAVLENVMWETADDERVHFLATPPNSFKALSDRSFCALSGLQMGFSNWDYFDSVDDC